MKANQELPKMLKYQTKVEDFPGGPVAKTPSSQIRGHGFYPKAGT